MVSFWGIFPHIASGPQTGYLLPLIIFPGKVRLSKDLNKHRMTGLINISLLISCWTRMTTFIKAKLKKWDDQTNIDKCRVAANVTEYLIISKLIFLRLIILKFIMIRQLFYVKNVCKNVTNQHVYMDVLTVCSQLEFPRFLHFNCIRNHH